VIGRAAGSFVRVGLVLLTPLSIVGCASSSHFPQECDAAEEEICAAKDEAADDGAGEPLASAKRTMKEAKAAEAEASRDREEARERLATADERAARAAKSLDLVRGLLARAEEQRGVHEAEIARVDSHGVVLRERGVTEGEVEQLSSGDKALAQRRLETTSSRIDALEQQRRLHELERKDAELERTSARARIDTADQRLEVVRLLFRHAQALARQARSEALDVQRAEASARLTTVRS
jgi:hypothetical protein